MNLEKDFTKYTDALIIFCAFVFYSIHFIFFHGGYFGFDDIEYCKLADAFAKGTYEHSSLYAFRYATIIPLALTYYVSGVSDLANVITMFTVYSITLYLVLKALNGLDPVSKWITGLLMIFAPMHLMYVEKPMPDLIVECGFFISFLSYYSFRFDLKIFKNDSIWFAIGVIILFLAKETFLIYYPYFIGLLLLDVFQKRSLLFWKKSISLLTIFIMVYFGFYYWQMGDAFERIQSIIAGQYVSACAYDIQPLPILIERIVYQLWEEFARNLFLFPIGFAVYLMIDKNQKFKFITQSFLVLLLLANFMTISYTSYVPLCPDPRHHMYIIPLSAMVLGLGVSQISSMSFRNVVFILTSFGLLLILSAYKNFENCWWLYLPSLGAIYAGYKKNKLVMIILFTLAFLSVYIQNINYNNKVNYKDQKELNAYSIYKIPGFKYIISDRVNCGYGQLHSQFDTSLVKFIDFKSMDTFAFKPEIPQYLIMNGMTSYLSNTSWETLPEWIKTAHEKMPKIFENKSGAVYKIK